MKPYRFHREARAEYRAALAWYAARSLDAADGFADAIANGIRGIRELPEAWPMWPGRPDVRKRVVRRYPYSIVYVVRGPNVVIIAVAHEHERAFRWTCERENRWVSGFPFPLAVGDRGEAEAESGASIKTGARGAERLLRW